MHDDDILRRVDAAIGLLFSDTAAALARAEEALALAEHAAPHLRVRALRARGLAHSHGGEHARGLGDLQAALAATPPGDTALRSSVLRGLAIGCELLGALEQGLSWATQALAAARADGNPVLVADALMTVGVVRSRSGDPAGGLENYLEVLAIFESMRDLSRCVRVLNNMGINCKNLGRHEESLAHFDRALVLVREVGDPGMLAVLQSNRAEPLVLMGRLEEACEVLTAAVEQLAPGGHAGGEIHARVSLGRVLLAKGDEPGALAMLASALALDERSGGRNYSARAHQSLFELHKGAGRFEQALQHHEAWRHAERVQFNEESDRKLAALRVQFELAQARHDAELQRLQHVELATAHAALLEADREKSHLLQRLEAQSRTDALTGLANRRQLDDRLADEFALAQRHRKPLAVAMCDLDFFKRINDRLGHAVGDEVLRRVGAILRERCRGTDLVARYGGEEFCVAFLEAEASLAAKACDALRQAIANHPWHEVHPDLSVTLSVGLSDDLALRNHEQLLADADTHLYRAKHEGKNRVCWHGDGNDWHAASAPGPLPLRLQ